MDKAERERLERDLSEQLGIKVILDEYVPPGTIYLVNLEDNPYWTDKEVKEWVALPADEAFIMSVSKAVKNAIKIQMQKMKVMEPLSGPDQLANLKFPD
jgi:hypothetical protein